MFLVIPAALLGAAALEVAALEVAALEGLVTPVGVAAGCKLLSLRFDTDESRQNLQVKLAPHWSVTD